MNSNGIQIRISDLLYAVWKRWRLILLLTLAGFTMGAAMLGVSYAQGELFGYQISCSIAVASKVANGNYTSDNHTPTKDDYYLAADMPDAVSYILKSDRVLDKALQQTGRTDLTAKELRRRLQIEQYNETQILELNLEWSGDTEGIALMNAILDETSKLLPQTLQMGAVEVIDEPTAKSSVGGTVASGMWFILGILGFLAGIGIAALDLLLRPTLINTKDVENVLGLDTIGTIPEDPEYFRRGRLLLENSGAGISYVEQSYASCAYIIRNLLGTKEGQHCFYVTSTENQEGRTSAAANLAVQFSDMERKVLLVDLDTRSPSLGGLFLKQVDYSHSLNALYKGEASPKEAITTLTGYLDFLPMILEHNAIALDGTLFDFLKRLGENYEYVILDAPPVGRISDALSLNQVADSVLFVIGYDQAILPDIRGTLEKLEKSGIRILGCVVNRVPGGNSRERRTKVLEESRQQNPYEDQVFMDFEDLPEREQSSVQNPLVALDQEPEESVSEDLSDQDAVDALLRMGVGGSWREKVKEEDDPDSGRELESQNEKEKDAESGQQDAEGNEPPDGQEGGETEQDDLQSVPEDELDFDYPEQGSDQGEDDFDI